MDAEQKVTLAGHSSELSGDAHGLGAMSKEPWMKTKYI